MQVPKKQRSDSSSSQPVASEPAQLRFDAESFLTAIRVGRSTKSYKANIRVFQQGDPAAAVFYIIRGNVKLAVVSKKGKEGIVAILSAGDFFGEGCLTGEPLYLSSATALADSMVVRIERQAMLRALRGQPTLSEKFMAFLLARNIQLTEDLVDQLFNSSERRLARVLLLLANFGKDGKLEPVIPRICQDILAAKVGTTRSRINIFMNKFRKLGFIEYDGGLGGLKVHSGLLSVIVNKAGRGGFEHRAERPQVFIHLTTRDL